MLPKIELLFFLRDAFGIEYPSNVDMPLNKETSPDQAERQRFNLLDWMKGPVWKFGGYKQEQLSEWAKTVQWSKL